MKQNPLIKLEKLGQSLWLDYIRRDLMETGELRRLIEDDGVRGITSNPAIFEKSIVDGHEYDAEIQSLAREGKNAKAIYEALTQNDVQLAAHELVTIYKSSRYKDGYVSLEVNPHLAHDTTGTISEARRLWGALNRPNVFIKVPATAEGLPAIKQLVSDGINVNVTLLFGLPRYRQVAEAFIAGIEARLAHGQAVDHVVSVASFFVSRIDSMVDTLLEKIITQGGSKADLAKQIRGQVAVASAHKAYEIFKEIFTKDKRFLALSAKGARVQRLLWASTGIKNPDFSDVKYVEALIEPDTVNTVPIETLYAYRDHGVPMIRMDQDDEQASGIMNQLSQTGINIDDITQKLEDEGVEKFSKPFDNLMEILAQRSSQKYKTV